MRYRMISAIAGVVFGVGLGLLMAETCRPGAVWFYRDVLGLGIATGCR